MSLKSILKHPTGTKKIFFIKPTHKKKRRPKAIYGLVIGVGLFIPYFYA